MNYWTPEAVKIEMVDAVLVLYDTTGSIGPAGIKTAWPAFKTEDLDIWYQVGSGSNTVGRMRSRIQRRAHEVTACDNIMTGMKLRDGTYVRNWVSQFLLQEGGSRRCLLAHVFGQAQAELRGKNFKASVWCRNHQVAESTFRSRRDRGAEIIASGLNRFNVPVW